MDDARAAERLGWARIGAERDIATGSGGSGREGERRGAHAKLETWPALSRNPFRKFTLAAEVPSLLHAIAVLCTLVREPFSL